MFISKRKNGFYYIHYNDESKKRISVTTGKKIKSEALKFLTSFREDCQLKKFESPITFQVYMWQYLKHSEITHSYKTTLAYKLILKQFNKFYNNPCLSDITQTMIEKYLQQKFKVSVYTAQKNLAYLRSFFNKAIEDEYLEVNPCHKIKNFKIPQKLPLYFSNEEFKKLLDAVDNPDIKDIILLAVNTGMREMEILTLHWNQIDFKEKLIYLNNHNHMTKSKKIRSIPMNESVIYLLTNRFLNSRCNLIFDSNGMQLKQDFITKKFKKYVRKAKLNDRFKFHTLRHTFASWLVQKGVNIYQVSKLLGHADIKTTEIYAHLSPNDLKKCVELINY
jgi:integrase